MSGAPIRILLIDDDPGEKFLVGGLLEEAEPHGYELHWVSTCDGGVRELCRNDHDLALVDDQLGVKSGLDCVREARNLGSEIPTILLTGAGDREVDLAAMEAGAVDYLVKQELSASLLERSIRYALAHDRAKKELARSEARLRAIWNNAPIGILVERVVDRTVAFANPLASRLLGYDERAMIGMNGSEIWPRPLDLAELFDEASARHSIRDREARMRCADGSEIPVLTSVNATRFDNEEAVIYSFHDITARLRAEKALRESEHRLQLILDNNPALVAYVDRDCRFEFVNKTFEDWFGIDRESFENHIFAEALGEEYFAPVKPWLERALAGESVEFELEREYAAKGRSVVQTSYVPDRDEGGRIQGVYIFVNDVTEARKFAQENVEGENRIRLITDNIPARIAYVDVDGIYRFMNAHYETTFGRPRSEMLNRHVGEVIGGEAFEFAKPWIQKALAGIPVTFEAQEINRNSSKRDLEVSYFPDKDSDSRTRGYYILVQDITERKRVEHALRNSELELRRALDVQSATFDALPAHIALLDRLGRITWVNENWKQMTIINGLSDDFFGVGRKYLDVCGPTMGVVGDTAELAGKRIKEILSARASSFSLDYPWHLPNRRRWFRMMVNSVPHGGSAGIVVMHLDITVEREVDERLRQAEKTQALGNLAGGIAHEINNMLVPIGLLAEATKSRLRRGSREFRNLEKVIEANDRATEIVQGMLTFSRKDVSRKAPIELPVLVKEAVALLRTVLPVDIRIRQDIGRLSSHVVANATQIHQIIMNIALNAADAMSDGSGTLTISVREVSLREPAPMAGGQLGPGRYAQIILSDTGGGIREEAVEQIFDPFYTTKEVGKGTGLGLSVVLGIVLTHGGGIQLSSKLNQGTSFRVFLPLAKMAAIESG